MTRRPTRENPIEAALIEQAEHDYAAAVDRETELGMELATAEGPDAERIEAELETVEEIIEAAIEAAAKQPAKTSRHLLAKAKLLARALPLAFDSIGYIERDDAEAKLMLSLLADIAGAGE